MFSVPITDNSVNHVQCSEGGQTLFAKRGDFAEKLISSVAIDIDNDIGGDIKYCSRSDTG